MARNRSKSEEKRDSILQAAMQLFTEQGFDNTSMDQLAQHAEVSKQTVYSHFGSKEELFSAAIENKCLAHNLTPEDFREFDCPQVALTTIAVRFHELLQTREAVQVFRTCVAQADSHPELAQLFFEVGPLNMIKQVSTLLEEFDQAGSLSIVEPHFAAAQFLMMVHGEARLRLELNVEPMPAEEEQRYLESCVTAFLRAYAP